MFLESWSTASWWVHVDGMRVMWIGGGESSQSTKRYNRCTALNDFPFFIHMEKRRMTPCLSGWSSRTLPSVHRWWRELSVWRTTSFKDGIKVFCGFVVNVLKVSDIPFGNVFLIHCIGVWNVYKWSQKMVIPVLGWNYLKFSSNHVLVLRAPTHWRHHWHMLWVCSWSLLEFWT